jgi:ferritin-like metal-binding protein YciE
MNKKLKLNQLKLKSMKNQNLTNGSMQTSQLMKLFEDELKDIYWAEKAVAKVIPKMIKNATSQDLVDTLAYHLIETENQVTRLEQIFESIGKKAVAKKCEAMEGLIKEVSAIMESCDEGAMCDAGIILAAQKIEHYQIASYGTLCAFAETLGEDDAVNLLQESLDEEKEADEELSEIAQTINVDAANNSESGGDLDLLVKTKLNRK